MSNKNDNRRAMIIASASVKDDVIRIKQWVNVTRDAKLYDRLYEEGKINKNV